MEQEFYTPEEQELLRAQLRNANAEAMRVMKERGYTLHPRIAEEIERRKNMRV